MANELEIDGAISGRTTYALLSRKDGKFWNGSTWETYATANRGNYDIAMTELGSASGIFQGDFPTAITDSGTYSYKVYQYADGGVAPTEADIFTGGGTVDWTGSAAATASVGSMSGSDFYDYLLRQGFKRTDKSTEAYEAITDAIRDMRLRFSFDEAEAEASSTDTISSLGDFKITLESDHGLLLGVVMEDGTNAHPLTQVSKARFDQLYPDLNVTADRGYPKHFCVYAGSVYIGPQPDSVSYTYRLSYSKRGGTVTASTSAVPFTALYRETVADGAQYRLYKMLGQFERAEYYAGKYEGGIERAIRADRKNTAAGFFSVYPLGM